MIAPELDELFRELEERVLLFGVVPVEPADLVILAIGVVVSLLSPLPFIARSEHWNALGKKKRCEKISALAATQFVNFWIIRRPFGPVVPRVIVVVAVAI